MRRTDSLRGGGAIREAVEFYNVTETPDSSQSLERDRVLAYSARAHIGPFQGIAARDAERFVVGEVWASAFIRYHDGRIPVEGMLLKVVRTGEFYEIKGSQRIEYDRKKVELTLQLLR
jgi:hypothetical protein